VGRPEDFGEDAPPIPGSLSGVRQTGHVPRALKFSKTKAIEHIC